MLTTSTPLRCRTPAPFHLLYPLLPTLPYLTLYYTLSSGIYASGASHFCTTSTPRGHSASKHYDHLTTLLTTTSTTSLLAGPAFLPPVCLPAYAQPHTPRIRLFSPTLAPSSTYRARVLSGGDYSSLLWLQQAAASGPKALSQSGARNSSADRTDPSGLSNHPLYYFF